MDIISTVIYLLLCVASVISRSWEKSPSPPPSPLLSHPPLCIPLIHPIIIFLIEKNLRSFPPAPAQYFQRNLSLIGVLFLPEKCLKLGFQAWEFYLKVPKCEIFDPFFFTPINRIWVGDLRTGEKKNFF